MSAAGNPKEFGLAIEWDGSDDLYGVMGAVTKRLADEVRRQMDELAAHSLELHEDKTAHPDCRICNPPPPYLSELREQCQSWTEGDVTVTRHQDECTCHDDCYSDYDY